MNPLKIYLCGQKYFGQEVLKMLAANKQKVVGVSAPPVDEKGKPDRLYKLAKIHGLPLMAAGKLNATNLPKDVDLIVCAHSHDFIGTKTLQKTMLGAIGYHPSLLPRHRGRDAVYWSIKMGDKVTGGSVYWFNDKVDGGDIAAQGWCFIRDNDTASKLWQRELQQMGVALLQKVIADLGKGIIVREAQDEQYATWEPSVGRPPLFRPDLIQLGHAPEGFKVQTKTNKWGAEEVKDNRYALEEEFGFHPDS
jgi:methionyl-tRNA formyltransferase